MSSRAKLYAAIFCQCKGLRLDENGRRDATEAVVGKRSLKECTEKELSKIIGDFKERGAVLEKPKRKRVGSRRPVKGAPAKIDRMITMSQRETIERWVEWKGLSAAYVRGISRRICGRDFPQTTKQASTLIAVLSSNRIPSQASKTKEQHA